MTTRHTASTRKPKVLLLDRDWAQTAYLAAHLSRAGIDVSLASGRSQEPWGLGRYCRLIAAPKGIDDRQFLETVISEEQADIVLPLCETTQMLLWDFPAQITANVHPKTNAHQRLLLSDRREMYKFIGSLGVPVPALIHLLDEADIDDALRRLGLPLVLRGTQGLSGDQVRIVADRQSAVNAYRELHKLSPQPPFAQSFITGQRCLIGGLFDKGRMLQWFSQTTIEAIWATGPSLRVKSVRDPVLTAYAEKLFAGIEWTGLACAEFIRSDSGEYYFLEINPRPWAAIQAAHYCGVPLMSMYANYLLGRVPATQAEFPKNKEATLFPQFISARLRTRRFQWRDLRAYAQAIAGAPWSYPSLLLHFFRRIWWDIRA